MEVDEKVREEMLENISFRLNVIKEIYTTYIEQMKKARSVEEIMLLKRDMLVELVFEALPLDTGDCYFCLVHDKCEECEYGWKHGICADYDIKDEEIDELIEEIRERVGNDFDLIRFLNIALRNAIRKYYYSGEVYGDEEPKVRQKCALCGRDIEVPISVAAKYDVSLCAECEREIKRMMGGRC